MAAVDIDVPVDAELQLHNQDDLERQAEGFKEQGNAFYSKKDYSKAFNYYTKAIDACPKNASYYGNRAATLMMLCRFREALEDSQQAVRLDDCFMKGHLREGKCHLSLGNAMAASRCFQKVLEMEPSNREAQQENKNAETLLEFERLADFGFEKRDFRKVVYCMDRALGLASACHRFKILKAECLALLGRYPEAQSVASDILRMDSTNADALYVRGLCLYYEDCIDKAVQFFVQALRMAPDHEKARLACRNAKALKAKKEEGNLTFKNNNYDAAYQLYTEALGIDPNNIKTNAKLYCNRATAGVKLSKLNQAIDDCTSAIKLDDSYIKAYLRRAQCYMDTEQYEEAVRDYEKVYQTEKTADHKHLLKTAKLELKKSKRKDYYKTATVRPLLRCKRKRRRNSRKLARPSPFYLTLKRRYGMTTGTTSLTMAPSMAEILMQTTSSGLSSVATVEDLRLIPMQTPDLEISFSSLAKKKKEHTIKPRPVVYTVKMMAPQAPPRLTQLFGLTPI
ncbi:dnaJ homolog subfamily C member 7-like isoform X1 [Dunckerocampus dactyliophorus]|uniref:dnaJ homolog subfamily C member 7-like isoform X1 n=1 Tax=Dunckerocampus dactyliophorus TaxID=161453 RepID=UPI00240704BE|nr:dnaJ homolog subfamily C member 7-like isoform X1 [Dunckerocampus dactyliophorus]